MKKPLPPLLFSFIAGILAGNYFDFPQYWVMGGIVGACLGMLFFIRDGNRKIALTFSAIIFVLFGFLYITRILHPDFPPHHLIHLAGDRSYLIEGVLYQPPESMQEKTKLFIRTERAFLQEKSWPVAGNLLLWVKDRGGNFRYGDRVRFPSRLYLPKTPSNPGEFDYRRFLALQGIWVTGYINNFNEVVRLEEGQGSPFFHFVERARDKIRLFFDQNAPLESRGIIKALVLGERGDIAREVNEKFIVTGVNHILSISGLHVALVAGFFFGMCRFILRLFPSLLLRLDLNKTSALVAVIPVIFYTFIAGLAVAAVRSTIMAVALLLALLLDREKDLYDALFLAAFLILVVTPAALFDISFQLSFVAVLAMLYLFPRIKEFFSLAKSGVERIEEEGKSRFRKKLLTYIGATLLTSAAATLGTGPLVVYYFNRISLVGFLSNLFLVPLMGFANTLLSLLAALLAFVFPLAAQWLTAVNVFLLDISLALVDLFSRIPLASKRVTTPTILEVLILYGMVILAANLKRWRRAMYGLIPLVILYGAIQGYEGYTIRYGKEMSVTFLSVGQGDAAAIRFPGGKWMVIDGGGSLDGSFDPGERIVAPYLWKIRSQKIEYLVNSHPHPDHLQGLLFLLENFGVAKVWENGEKEGDNSLLDEFLNLADERFKTMSRGQKVVEINGVKVKFLHPPREKGTNGPFMGNNASLVMRLTYGEIGFLFCGDVEAKAEAEILETKADLKSTVIKVPHHGSKTSSTLNFLEQVGPQYAVFTVRGGRSPLPNAAVLERYEKLGAKIYRTDRDGAITFTTDGKSLRVQTFLKRKDSER